MHRLLQSPPVIRSSASTCSNPVSVCVACTPTIYFEGCAGEQRAAALLPLKVQRDQRAHALSRRAKRVGMLPRCGLGHSVAAQRCIRPRCCTAAARGKRATAGPTRGRKRRPAPVEERPAPDKNIIGDYDEFDTGNEDFADPGESTLSQYLTLGALLGQDPETVLKQTKMRGDTSTSAKHTFARPRAQLVPGVDAISSMWHWTCGHSRFSLQLRRLVHTCSSRTTVNPRPR